VKDVVKKPIAGAKEDGSTGFIKGLAKGFLGLIIRPLSSIADLVSTSCSMIKR
jgi:vacuolar protein sorting-associated protein 13A/C